ncbi:MAG: hypothetical protein HQK73_02125 [Desulfamplus sp.]|nr:hypothetical protein [Desulfamplus sp.]MBF0411714.1 hypothetical protein [Desulfamplus sp.]
MAIENDIILVYMEDSPIFFARVEEIWPDIKKDWFNIELLVLQIPVKIIVWTLKDIYINGTEFFMGGKRMRIEVVRAPRDNFMEEHEEEAHDNSITQLKKNNSVKSDKEGKVDKEESGQVISIAAFQKKKRITNEDRETDN